MHDCMHSYMYHDSQRYTYLLYNAVSPSSEAYKSKYAWWGAVELLRRGLLIVLTVALPGKEVMRRRKLYIACGCTSHIFFL